MAISEEDLDRMLEDARVETAPYTQEDVDAAWQRVAKAVAEIQQDDRGRT